MNILENGYANLPNGTVIELSGKDLSNIVYVNTKALSEDALARGKVEATERAQFSLGGRSFTIMNTDQESIDLLKDKAKRKTLAYVTLEATSYDRPNLDPETGEPDGNTTRVNSFRFISCTTVEDAVAYAASLGKVQQEEKKWAPATNVTQSSIDKAVDASMSKFMNAFMAKQPTPVAPAPAEVNAE